jgi:tRNA pseudouridine38-40 synthase
VSGPRIGIKNIMLLVEYDGSDFCGWQKQPKVRTVEGEMGRVLAGLLGSEPEIIAAGRTDSGVHALGQVVNFSSASAMEPVEIMNALNSLLPTDVRVLEASEVPLAFNARYDALKRVYRYEISTRPTSVWRKLRWRVRWQLDLDAMAEALRPLAGNHDFSAYTCKDEERSPWIEMKETRVGEVEPGVVMIVFTADRFLRRMVRMLVGTVVEVGRGKMEPSAIYDILSSHDRLRAGPCAPPHGLYLVKVEY